MKAAIEAINQMQADGVICHYAVGGAVGATYYSEPASTSGLEIFVILPFNPDGSSVSRAALQDYLMARGRRLSEDCFELGGWPVNFLVASNDLESAAVAGSLPASIDGERTWVMMAEHLVAIALTANRLRDRIWILRLAEADAIDELTLKSILNMHSLMNEWAQFEQEYPPRFPTNNETRRKLSALSFSEKVKILEKLRDRERAIAASGLRRKKARDDDSPKYIQPNK